MILLMMGRDMRAMWPGEALFWFVMSLGVTVGFFIAYPINLWLVAKGMKHGLMTVRNSKSKSAMASMGKAEMASMSKSEMASMKGHGVHAVKKKEKKPAGAKGHSAPKKPGAGAESDSVTRPQLVTLTGVTSVARLGPLEASATKPAGRFV